MPASPDSSIVSVEEYLRASYDPDVEFVDGLLVERLGDWLHSLIQSNILAVLRRKYPHLKVVVEFRSRTAATRYRIPDVRFCWRRPLRGTCWKLRSWSWAAPAEPYVRYAI